MGTHDFTPLFDHYPEVIAQLPPTFDSHEFILRLAQQHQPEYIDALCAYRDTLHGGKPAPFLFVHSQLAQHLQACKDLVEQLPGLVTSRDIFGGDTDCARWRKVQ